MHTIFAQCSGKGKSGINVFRLSGLHSITALKLLVKTDITKMQQRSMYLCKIYNPENDQLIDEAMVVYFTKASSFTGEDIVEIHCHGSIAVNNLLHSTLQKIPNLRLAEPGEFAKRAFLNGKFDLTAAEGLADLIEAETEQQHLQAIRQMGGALEKLYDSWRKQLLQLISLLEAYIDFPDEDIPDEVLNQVNTVIAELKANIKEHLNDNRRGERLRNGLKLTILGRPNAGKSSLLNFLMQRDLAIVSDIAGTTRDVIEGHIDIGGYPIILQDTAGIHDKTDSTIEQEGIKRAKQISKEADIKLIIFDASKEDTSIAEFAEFIDKNTILILNKIDIKINNLEKKINNKNLLQISLKKQLGLKELLNKIEKLAEKIASPSNDPLITRERHRHSLRLALEYLENFSLDNDLILATEDIRMTIRAMSNIIGEVTVDEIIGEIFSNFCIGK
ncbi:MAG: tRNA uridine-5-carboxymethylaminomethyl(34) synthesis GTPase MnmE [Rickettsiaceae bacterium]|nr:tRNA uridine-5-carboxymethylaminomethyl(34) synthesis GTPase MnmE [Rickettsiaceae bacterium]